MILPDVNILVYAHRGDAVDHCDDAGGGLTPNRAAGFTPAAQPNAPSAVWRVQPAIFVYFAAVSGYNFVNASDAF